MRTCVKHKNALSSISMVLMSSKSYLLNPSLDKDLSAAMYMSFMFNGQEFATPNQSKQTSINQLSETCY